MPKVRAKPKSPKRTRRSTWNGPPDQPPTFDTVPALNAHPGVQLAYYINALDPDGDSVTYALVNNPPNGAQIDPSTGRFTWTPTPMQMGPNQAISVQATEQGAGLSSVYTFYVNVINQAPVIQPIPDRTIYTGHTLRFHVNVADPENDAPFGFNIISGPGTIDGTGLYTFTPQTDNVYSVQIRAVDQLGGASQPQGFNVTAFTPP
jgi:hypothetical protein